MENVSPLDQQNLGSTVVAGNNEIIEGYDDHGDGTKKDEKQ